MDIVQIETAIGENEIDLLEKYKLPTLIEKTGIKKVFQTSETTTKIAAKAIDKLTMLEKSNIDAMFLVTQSPDDYLPANSITLSNITNLPKTALTMDFNQGCSGFVQAFSICEKLLNYYSNILLVTADRYRSKCKPSDRSTNAVFSDGASASILTAEGKNKIIYEDHFTDGSYRDFLFQSVGEENDGFIHMAGADIWLFTKREVVPQISKAIKFSIDQRLKIKGIYIHQASKVVVDGIKGLLDIDKNLLFENYSSYGNTVSSTIPFLLKDFQIKLEPGEVIILAGFGVGLTSSVVVYGNSS